MSDVIVIKLKRSDLCTPILKKLEAAIDGSDGAMFEMDPLWPTGQRRMKERAVRLMVRGLESDQLEPRHSMITKTAPIKPENEKIILFP